MSSGNELILVDDPEELYARSRFDHYARIEMLQRPKIALAVGPYALRLGASRFQWEQHDPQFQAALPVLEEYSNATKPNAGQPLWVLAVGLGSTEEEREQCDIDPELYTKRLDFNQYFRFVVHVTGQTAVAGFSEEILDLNDDPWLEWVHPPQNFTNAFQPFRQYAQQAVKYQWPMLFYKSPVWKVEAEEDTYPRAFQPDDWFAVLRQIYITGGTFTFPAVQLELFQIEPTLGSITLIWSASPGAAGYRLYVNGVPQIGFMPATQQTLTINNLVLGTAYLYGIVAVDPFGRDSSSLSNVIMYEHSTTEVMGVFNLTSDDPGDFSNG